MNGRYSGTTKGGFLVRGMVGFPKMQDAMKVGPAEERME